MIAADNHGLILLYISVVNYFISYGPEKEDDTSPYASEAVRSRIPGFFLEQYPLKWIKRNKNQQKNETEIIISGVLKKALHV